MSEDARLAKLRLVRDKAQANRLLLFVAVFAAVVTSCTPIQWEQPMGQLLSVEGASGAFLLSADDPVAEVSFTMSANNVVETQGGPSYAVLKMNPMTLDPSQPSVVNLYLDGEDTGAVGWPRFRERCDKCRTGAHVYRFEYTSGDAPLLIIWSISAAAGFDEDVPEGAALNIEASGSGPSVPVTVIAQSVAGPGKWHHSHWELSSGTALDPDSDLWFGFDGTDTPVVLFDPEGDPTPVAMGGAAQIDLPAGCFQGPCTTSAEVVMAPEARQWTLVLVGESDVQFERERTDDAHRLATRVTAERNVSVDPGTEMELQLDIAISGVDPEIVEHVPPLVEDVYWDRDAGNPANIRVTDNLSGQTMSCRGETCSISVPIPVVNSGADTQDFLLRLVILVGYDGDPTIQTDLHP